VGDGNNVAFSLGLACVRLGVNFVIAAPQGYQLSGDYLDLLARQGRADGAGRVNALTDPYQAVRDADIIYTDTWVSMGQESQKQQRIADFEGYQVDKKLLAAAGANVRFMHCLPAYRGLEVTDEVIEAPQSIVFAQARNRLHFQRALLKYLLPPIS
jgi:ornithine carbamoyltransferase